MLQHRSEMEHQSVGRMDNQREAAGGGCGREGRRNGDAVQSSGKADPGRMLAMIMSYSRQERRTK